MSGYFFYDSFREAAKNKEQKEFIVVKDNFFFPFSWQLKDSEKILLFLPGAIDRARALPVFQRSSYFSKLPCTCVSTFDPTVFYRQDMKMGWYQGVNGVFFADLLKSLIIEMLEALNRKGKDLYIYTTSAGGIPAINIASAIDNCTVYCGNIQSDIFNFHPGPLNTMLQVSYEGMNAEEIKKKYNDRLNIFGLNGDFTFFYAQNKADLLHYNKHFMPYVNSAHTRPQIKASFITYYQGELGHDPFPREVELDIIRSLIETGEVSLDCYPPETMAAYL